MGVKKLKVASLPRPSVAPAADGPDVHNVVVEAGRLEVEEGHAGPHVVILCENHPVLVKLLLK